MSPRLKKAAAGTALIAAMAVGGAAIGDAATSPSTSPSTSTTTTLPVHGSAAHESAETTVTGSAATQAQQAAVKAVGSGTAGAVTTDFGGKGYEVTVTNPDGSTVEIHLDSSFSVIQGR
jgi:hypothetical protein